MAPLTLSLSKNRLSRLCVLGGHSRPGV